MGEPPGDPDVDVVQEIGEQLLGDVGVVSERLARLTGLPELDRVIAFIEGAGHPVEAETERDGFLSYSAEVHAAGAGAGLGFMIAASGELRYFGLLYEGLIVGNRGDQWFSGELLRDVRKEKHYFLGGLLVGAAFGLAAQAVTGLVAKTGVIGGA